MKVKKSRKHFCPDVYCKEREAIDLSWAINGVYFMQKTTR